MRIKIHPLKIHSWEDCVRVTLIAPKHYLAIAQRQNQLSTNSHRRPRSTFPTDNLGSLTVEFSGGRQPLHHHRPPLIDEIQRFSFAKNNLAKFWLEGYPLHFSQLASPIPSLKVQLGKLHPK